MVEKGSIAVDGVSLTVVAGRRQSFDVSLDPGDAGADQPGRLPPWAAPSTWRSTSWPSTWRSSWERTRDEGELEQVARDEVQFATIEEALEDIAAGKMVVVVDDEDRENEGDLVMAAEFITADDINFMTRQAGGWICLALTPERCDELGLELMSLKNESAHETPFTVTIEAREGVTTGISTADQATTIRTAVDPAKGKADIVVPGHVHPLKARSGGVLERTGHTEASVDLARLAGCTPAGVICEVQNEDGSMARVGDLAAYCHKHGLKMITIADLIAYRRRHDKLVERVVSTVDADRLRRLHGRRLPLAGRRQAPRRDGQGRGRRQGGRAGPRALRVPDRRRLPLAALRLRRAAGVARWR